MTAIIYGDKIIYPKGKESRVLHGLLFQTDSLPELLLLLLL